jgi:hypothetical protein
MTSQHRDFDRIARAWLELGPNEAPDRPIAAVLQAIETTPQVRRPWRWPVWRSTTMSRITILAVLAGTIALVVGGLVLTSGTNTDPVPTIAPSPVDASAAPAPPLATLPEGIGGGWVAASRGTTIEDLRDGAESALGGNAAVTTIAIMDDPTDTQPPHFWLDRRGTALLESSVAEVSPGVIRLTMVTMANPGCVGRDSGDYRWSLSPDGQWLTLELVEDACETRAEILPGTWQRSLAHDSSGGPGIAAIYDPYLTFTLPEDTYLGWGLGLDALVVDSEVRTFKVWKDLDGFADPCDLSKGRLAIDPGMDALLDYFRTDPRFTVTSEEEFQLDGHRAVDLRFTMGANLSAPCWDLDGDPANKNGVLTWVPGAEIDPNHFWNGPIGSPGLLVITEVDGATLAFEAATIDGGDFAIDRATLDTVRFLDTLPAPPPS